MSFEKIEIKTARLLLRTFEPDDLEPLYWNQGYVTEAARACLRFIFENSELERIVALSYPQNTGSWRVMEKVGMTFEQTAHHYHADLLRYAITRDEFKGGSEAYALQLR